MQKHHVDVHVACRLRARRACVGLSKREIADRVGLSSQQIHNYEQACNRISASMLWQLAEALSVPVTYFFEGLESGDHEHVENDFLLNMDSETESLVRAFSAIDTQTRSKLLKLVNAVAA